MATETMDDGMEDMYSVKSLEKPAGKETRESIDSENEEDASNSTIVPKSLCGKDYKVGDTITFKVTSDFGDELELKPHKAMKSDDEEAEGEQPEYSSADDEISAMDEAR